MLLGAVLRKLRLERGLTQESLAHLAGTDAANISRMELDRQSPSLQMLYGLSRALQIPVSRIFERSEQEAADPSRVIAQGRSPQNYNRAAERLMQQIATLTPAQRIVVQDLIRSLQRQNRAQGPDDTQE